MADREHEERLDELAGIRPAEGAEAYTELARLRSAADPERDSRREAYRERERRRAARALDRYLETFVNPNGGDNSAWAAKVAASGERFVEAVGDYVLSGLPEGLKLLDVTLHTGDGASYVQQKSHYGVPEMVGESTCPMGPDCLLSHPHRNPEYGVRRTGGKRQFCSGCKRSVSDYRTFPFGDSGKVHVCDSCWPNSSWNTDNAAANAEGAHDF